MRLIAALSILFVFAAAVFLVGPGRRTQPATHPEPTHPAPPEPAKTNSLDGFFMGAGDQRTYVQYATPDPVMRSFMQSVMEGASDPTAKGKEIFEKICAACHQKDGGGKDGLAPPLAGSEWVLAPGGNRLVRIVLNGLSGPIQVRGKTWNLAMPPLKENLTDDQIAVALSYVRGHVGENQAARITAETATAARSEARKIPESSDSLQRVEAN